MERKPLFRNSLFAFRGYNVTNLGSTPELLEHALYGETVREYLEHASVVCEEMVQRPIDLVKRVRERRETDLASYDEAIAMIMAVEMAHLALLERHFGFPLTNASLVCGFSLGELSAVVACGLFELDDVMRIPLAVASDCVKLAEGVTLGVLFSRGQRLSFDKAYRLCLEINAEGRGVVGISCHVAPNSFLLVGQGDTLDRFEARMHEMSEDRLHLRRNDYQWPPLHTPIMWQKHIPNRSSQMMLTLPGGLQKPNPPILSLATGHVSYTDTNAREILARWVDHPQRLWYAIDYTLSAGVETIVHVGPQPNIIPGTFQRLAANVEAQTRGRVGMRALSTIIRRPWLQSLLPKRANLLRAPIVRHVFLEDWLLDQNGPSAKSPPEVK